MRYDTIAKVIISTACLTQCCRDKVQKSHILNRAYEMINTLWQFEFKSYRDIVGSERRYIKVEEFWNNVSQQLGVDDGLYDFKF